MARSHLLEDRAISTRIPYLLPGIRTDDLLNDLVDRALARGRLESEANADSVALLVFAGVDVTAEDVAVAAGGGLAVRFVGRSTLDDLGLVTADDGAAPALFRQIPPHWTSCLVTHTS